MLQNCCKKSKYRYNKCVRPICYEYEFEEITFISKIHDEFLLASTDKGSILQINGKKEIFNKNILNMKIKSVLMIDCETLIISGNNKSNNGQNILTLL